jgi:hypothetical protein
MRMQRGNAKSKCRGIAGMVRHAFVSGYNHVTISHLYSILRSQPATPFARWATYFGNKPLPSVHAESYSQLSS